MENDTYIAFTNYLVIQKEITPAIGDSPLSTAQVPTRSWRTTYSHHFLICAVSTLVLEILEELAIQLTLPFYWGPQSAGHYGGIRPDRYEASFDPQPYIDSVVILTAAWIGVRYLEGLFSKVLPRESEYANPYCVDRPAGKPTMRGGFVGMIYSIGYLLSSKILQAIGNQDFTHHYLIIDGIRKRVRFLPGFLFPFSLLMPWNALNRIDSYAALNDTIPEDLMDPAQWSAPQSHLSWKRQRQQLCAQHQAVVVAASKYYRVESADRAKILQSNVQHFQARAAELDTCWRSQMREEG